MKILIGADPELFVTDPQTGKFVSGHGLIKGTKREPFKVPKGAVQVDGMALEFNIDPASSRMEFVDNVKSVYGTLAQMVPGLRLMAKPVAMFDQNYFDRQPEVARELGCDPDYNAWTGEENPRPKTNKPMRTGSGHLHLGWTEGKDITDPGHVEDCRAVVKQLDNYLGVYSLLWDPDDQRRVLYGKAGAHRIKSYGVEYRTLSNRWLADDRLIPWVYDAAYKAVDDLDRTVYAPDRTGKTAQRVIDGNMTHWPEFYGKTYFADLPMPPQI